MLSGEGGSVSKTTGMLAQKQPSLKECVTAHRSRDTAPKINGAQARNRSGGINFELIGRGAFSYGRRSTGRTVGRMRRENAGMSSENLSEKLKHRKPEVSRATLVAPG